MLYAFDLIEHDGIDLSDLPLIERKRRLKKLIGKAKRRAILFVEHLKGDEVGGQPGINRASKTKTPYRQRWRGP